MKLELLTNATVVDDAIRFVAERSLNSKAHEAITELENERLGSITNRVF